MNKTELVAAMAESADLSKKDAEKALKAFIEVVTDELKKDEKVQLVGFGTFEVAQRAAREPYRWHGRPDRQEPSAYQAHGRKSRLTWHQRPQRRTGRATFPNRGEFHLRRFNGTHARACLWQSEGGF